jgi:hypothetical protein
VIAAGLLALIAVMAWPGRGMMSRDIGCANMLSQRGKQLCQALSQSMEWTWMGHAIVSPGWRITWRSLRRVYCREGIGVGDLAVLQRLKRTSDWRLQDAADDLIRLIGTASGQVNEPENSIFSPANPDYLLKGGCIEVP